MEEFARNHPALAGDVPDLHAWLLNSQAQERHRMNPYRIAQATGISVDTVIRMLLLGTRQSLFELHWQQHCPHCNMVTSEYHSLSTASGQSHCKMCDMEYTADFKERVEVTFSLHPSIEKLDIPPFCLPPKSLQPLAQLSMAMGEIEEADFNIEPGVYRYYCPITMSMGRLYVEESSPSAGKPEVEKSEAQNTPAEGAANHEPASFADAGQGESELYIQQLENNTFDPPEIRIPAGMVHLKAENSTVPISGLIIHEDKLADPIPYEELELHLSGLEIMHYPEFRRLFGDDALSEREKMTISGVTILFTDITGSTRMYEKLGDIQAYNIVRDHFQILIESIEYYGGVVTKTIGDAVMASFTEPSRAIRAVYRSLGAFEDYNEGKEDERQIILKMGIHEGPAILVNLNDRLDYFGSTINKAARIQSLARSHQLVFSEEIWRNANIRSILKEHGTRQLIRKKVSLKGLSGSHPVYFLDL